jgi:succinate dehydrogenase / fumarate reductase, flavoprotein subunit
VLEQFEYAT